MRAGLSCYKTGANLKKRINESELEKSLASIRACSLCAIELMSDNIHKSCALWKQWYVCKSCYQSKVKKRYVNNKNRNPLKHKAMVIRRRFTFSDVTQDWMEEQIVSVLGKPCFYCKTPLILDRVSPDHKQPVSRGGTNNRDNIRLVCRGCNTKKGALTESEFLKLLEILEPYAEIKSAVLARMGTVGFAFNR